MAIEAKHQRTPLSALVAQLKTPILDVDAKRGAADSKKMNPTGAPGGMPRISNGALP
jgi:hypothetical protein